MENKETKINEEIRELTDEELRQITGGVKRVPIPTGATTILTGGGSTIDDFTGDFTGNYA